MLSVFVYLGEDSSQSALVAVVAERSIREQCIGSVSAGVVYYGLGD
jgi:hypothetical protein